LEASVKVRGDGRRKEAEANFNMGVTYEKQGLNIRYILDNITYMVARHLNKGYCVGARRL
jgi:hypothetical protein